MQEWNDPASDYRPIHVMGYATCLTTLLVIIHCVTMVICTMLISVNGGGALALLTFSSRAVLSGQVWQLFTYAFVNTPSVWFAIEMLMLYWFGRDVERFVGRNAFVMLYAALILIPAVELGLIGFRYPQVFAGSGAVHFSIFIAFATIYPGAIFFARVAAKYVAFILLAIYSLQNLANHDWTSMLVIWSSAAIAHCGMRFLGVQGGFPWWSNWIQERRQQKLVRQSQLRIVRREEEEKTMDEILGKISKEGMKSLTSREKEALEKARKALLQKEKQ